MRKMLLAGIVPRGSWSEVHAAASAAGAGGGTVIPGEGTADSAVLELLGLGGGGRDVYFTVVDEAAAPGVAEAIDRAASGRRAHRGVRFSAAVSGFRRLDGRGADSNERRDPVETQTGRVLVQFVVNRGFAQDAMAAARGAGAAGGTVLHGHGTARPGDAEFFGVALVPEKEILMIVVERGAVDAVIDAVNALPCFAEKGSGVVFALPLEDFSFLGGEK